MVDLVEIDGEPSTVCVFVENVCRGRIYYSSFAYRNKFLLMGKWCFPFRLRSFNEYVTVYADFKSI